MFTSHWLEHITWLTLLVREARKCIFICLRLVTLLVPAELGLSGRRKGRMLPGANSVSAAGCRYVFFLIFLTCQNSVFSEVPQRTFEQITLLSPVYFFRMLRNHIVDIWELSLFLVTLSCLWWSNSTICKRNSWLDVAHPNNNNNDNKNTAGAWKTLFCYTTLMRRKKNCFLAKATFLCWVWVLSMPGWVFSVDSGFLPHPKSVHVKWTGESKWPQSEWVWVYVALW